MAERSMDDVSAEQKLVVAVIIDKKITVGGGFNQSVNAAKQIIAIAPSSCDVRVLTRVKENVEILKAIGLKVDFLDIPKRTFSDRLKRLTTSRRKKNESISPFEKEMIRRGVAVVYFTSPSPNALDLQTLPYVFTIWDLCHLDHPEFPEVSSGREFEKREELFRKAVPKAFLTITDSEYTTRIAKKRYGGRFLAIPFSPAPFTESFEDTRSVLEKYGVEPGYLFYPAQFWAHKNHARLLQAAAILKAKTGTAPTIVFSGSEQGNKRKIELLATRLGLEDTTRFLGFVSPHDVAALYKGSLALVMPSYFGPSNLPPLEAWSIGKPVLYPKQFVDFVGDAAVLFDPDDAHSLAAAIMALDEDKIYELEGAAKARTQIFNNLRSEAEAALCQILNILSVRLR